MISNVKCTLIPVNQLLLWPWPTFWSALQFWLKCISRWLFISFFPAGVPEKCTPYCLHWELSQWYKKSTIWGCVKSSISMQGNQEDGLPTDLMIPQLVSLTFWARIAVLYWCFTSWLRLIRGSQSEQFSDDSANSLQTVQKDQIFLWTVGTHWIVAEPEPLWSVSGGASLLVQISVLPPLYPLHTITLLAGEIF